MGNCVDDCPADAGRVLHIGVDAGDDRSAAHVDRIASAAPRRAPGITPTARKAAKRQSMSCSNACVIVPGMARRPTHASEVPMATFVGRFSTSLNPGTMTMPPPTPSSPDRSPLAMPMPTA